MYLARQLHYRTATIPNGTALSEILDVADKTLLAFYMPSAWTPANMTFLAGLDADDTLRSLEFEAAEISLAVAADQAQIVSPWKFQGIRRLQFRSGTQAAPVNQGAARTIRFVLGYVD